MKKVKKVWGEELWIINKEYCGKILSLKQGFRCSLHYHEKKNETFYLLSGEVLMEADKKKWIMRIGDVQHIKPRCVHRFTGLLDSEIIEFSTKHYDSDSYRCTESGKI